MIFPGGSRACAAPPGRFPGRAAGRRSAASILVACAAAASPAGGCAGATPEQRALDTLREAVAAFQAKDPERAETLARQAADERPGFVDPLFFLAALAERRGDFDGARTQYKTVLATDPTSTAAAVALAQTYLKQERFAEGELWLRRAIDEDPGAESAAFNLGSVADQTQRPDQAVAWFELSAALDLRDPRAPLQIARIRAAQGRTEDAIRAAQESARRDPNYAPAAAALRALGADPSAPGGR